MAQGEGFKHITVTAAEDEDVVILAGAVPADDVEAPVNSGGAQSPAPESKQKPSKSAKPAGVKRAKPKDDSYHETTLEDLEGAPMPFTQRIVIVAAIVCIIGAVIYCALFMG